MTDAEPLQDGTFRESVVEDDAPHGSTTLNWACVNQRGGDHFDQLLARAAAAPQHEFARIEDVGALAAILVSPAAARITGTVIPVDGGQHLLAA